MERRKRQRRDEMSLRLERVSESTLQKIVLKLRQQGHITGDRVLDCKKAHWTKLMSNFRETCHLEKVKLADGSEFEWELLDPPPLDIAAIAD